MGIVENSAMDVREDKPASGTAKTPTRGGVDRSVSGVVGHAFPEQGTHRTAVTGGGHGVLELALVEVRGDEVDALREAREDAVEGAPLGSERIRVVDLEDGDSVQRVEAIRARVESGSEDHDLLDPILEAGEDGIVDEARARDRRRARARPSTVDEPRETGCEEQARRTLEQRAPKVD
jgi:hypothetical protein